MADKNRITEIAVLCEDADKIAFDIFGQILDPGNITPSDITPELRFWNALNTGEIPGAVSFSILETSNRSVFCDTLECHTETTETLLPLDGDIRLFVAETSSSNSLNIDTVKCMRIPAGTGVTLNKGIWHYLPIVERNPVKILIVFAADTPGKDMNKMRLEKRLRMVL